MGSDKPPKPTRSPAFINDGFPAAKTGDSSDEKLVVGQMRALQREVRDGFESIGHSLAALVRIEERLHVIIDRQNVLDARVTDVETRQTVLDTRITALETRRAAAGRKR
jgi:hypothetical protein